MRGQRKGLHHRMVEKWHLIFGLNGLGAKASLHVAFACFAICLALCDCRVLRLENRCGGNTCVATVAKAGCQSAQAGDCGPIALGHHGDGIIKLDDLLHALDRQGRRGVHRCQLSAAHGCGLNRCHAHAGNRKIHAILRAAVDLKGDVETLHRLPHQAILRGVFQRWCVVER